MSTRGALLTTRDRADVLAELLGMLPGYTPEWAPEENTTAYALMQIFARYVETLSIGLEHVPERHMLAFLDMLGTRLLPAQAARAPLVFELIDGAPLDVTLPATSQVAAAGSASRPIIFATTQTITLTRARLAALYVVQPSTGEFADYAARQTTGFTLFGDMTLADHEIYLGHDRLFDLAGDIRLLLAFSLDAGAGRPLPVEWEYLTDGGWIPFRSEDENDSTLGLTKTGQIVLHRECGPKAKKETFFEHESYWLRGRLSMPLLADGAGGPSSVPVVNDIRVRVGIDRSGLLPEAAFAGVVPLDVTKDFPPFGSQPETHSTFYVASREVFQRTGARVQIAVTLSNAGSSPSGSTVSLAWEYSDGTYWWPLNPDQGNPFDFSDGTSSFTGTEKQERFISFLCPPGWQTTSVNGVENFWLRVRITSGNYGRPVRVTVDSNGQTKLAPADLDAPVISRMTLGYLYLTDPEALDHCLSRNLSVFADHSEACRWPDQSFRPFQPIPDRRASLYFGFDQPLPPGLLSMYVNVPEDDTSESSPFAWEYYAHRGWLSLGVLDETNGLRRSGMIQFIGQPDAAPLAGPGGELYRVRGRLKRGERATQGEVGGLWLNAVWAEHRSFHQETLGVSDGTANQAFRFPQTPVLEGETLEVREWTGQGDGWQSIVQDVTEQERRLDHDPVSGAATAAWVTWRGQPHLYHSAPNARHYVVERATGLLRFGDGAQGMMPPAGSRINVTYNAGGGVAGSLPAQAISQLRTAAPFVAKVANPVPSSGGADTEGVEVTLRRGPQRLRHLGRAVSAPDYEWLAREASPDVARVRCLAITGPAGHAQRGWVTMVVAPHSLEAQPQPAPEFRRRLREYLVRRVPASVARRVRILGPQYMPVDVLAEVVPGTPGEAAQVEALLRARLSAFLHPLSGGPDRRGWDFGQPLYLSQIARVIENTPGVDYARSITLRSAGQIFDEDVPVNADMLLASGDHELKLILGEV